MAEMSTGAFGVAVVGMGRRRKSGMLKSSGVSSRCFSMASFGLALRMVAPSAAPNAQRCAYLVNRCLMDCPLNGTNEVGPLADVSTALLQHFAAVFNERAQSG